MPTPDTIIRAIAKERGQPYEQVAAEYGQPVQMAPDAANVVDAAIATPVGGEATAALADAAIATPVGAQAEPPAPAPAPEPVQPVQLPPPVTDEVAGAPSVAAQASQPDAVAAPTAPTSATSEVSTPAAPAAAQTTTDTTAEADAAKPEEPAELAPLSLQPSLTSAQEDLEQIERDTTGATMRIAEADEAAAKEKAASAKKFLEDFDADTAKYGSEIDAAREGLKRNQEELRAANEEIAKLPPIKDSRGGMAKVFGALTIAIGGMQDQNNLVAGLMQGMNVQTNNAEQAASRIRESVERDISLQKMNYEKARDKRDAKLTEYGIARQLLGDSQQALRFATAMRGERFAAEMEAQAATLKSKTARDVGILKSSEQRMGFRKEQNDLLQAEFGARSAALQAIALGKMTAQQAADFIAGGGGTGDGAPTKAELAALERKRQADLLNLKGGNASQRGEGEIEAAEASYDDFVKTKPADWYNDTRTNKADAARESYVQLETVYSSAASALRTLKDPNATQEQKLKALTTYNEGREAVPQLLVAALGGGAAAEGEAARAAKNWPTVPNPNLSEVSALAGAGEAKAKEYWDKFGRNIDARPEAIEVSLDSVRARHYAVMNELGHRHSSLGQRQPAAPATSAAVPTAQPLPPARKPTAPSTPPKKRLTAADL